jgi:drug/metabolite transporter (DMT)-like permease
MSRFQKDRGYLYGLTAAIFYGTTSTLGKYALGTTDALTVAFFGYLIGSLIFLPIKRKQGFDSSLLRLVILANEEVWGNKETPHHLQ